MSLKINSDFTGQPDLPPIPPTFLQILFLLQLLYLLLLVVVLLLLKEKILFPLLHYNTKMNVIS